MWTHTCHLHTRTHRKLGESICERVLDLGTWGRLSWHKGSGARHE